MKGRDGEVPEEAKQPIEATEEANLKAGEHEAKPEVPDLVPDEPTEEDESDAESDGTSKTESPTQPYPDEKPDEEALTPFDDDKTGAAIDDIVAKEGDTVLAAQDAALETDVKIAAKKGGAGKRFWRNKLLWRFVFWACAAGVVAASVIPRARYFVLNAAGVRSSASVVVVDSSTQLPLKGVQVAIGPRQAKTGNDGTATLKDLKLGPTSLSIKQTGFADVNRSITIGWGSNPLGNVALKAVGIRYVIEVHDYLSDKPVDSVQATSGEASAVSDKNGKIVLTLASTVVAKDGVTLSKNGYRTEQITLNTDPAQPTKTALVMARKAVFIAKTNGRYNVYKSDIDGQNRELLLAGTGSENSNLSLVTSPDGNRAALVSTRDNKRDAGGFLQSSLVLINVENGDTVTIAEAPQIQLIDWIGGRLIFQQVGSDTAASNQYTVIAYNYPDNTRLQLAAANKLNAVLCAQGAVYYAVGADANDPSVPVGLFKVNPDGSNKQHAVKEEIWSVLRTDYNTLSLQQADETWHAYNLPNGAIKLSTPLSLASQQYLDNAGRTKSVWLNQGALLSYDVASGKDAKILTPASPTQPVQWLSADAVVFRIATSGETADYAASILGGSAHKIADVAATYGFTSL